eukprot:2156052-Rhodomonas_salina.1
MLSDGSASPAAGAVRARAGRLRRGAQRVRGCPRAHWHVVARGQQAGLSADPVQVRRAAASGLGAELPVGREMLTSASATSCQGQPESHLPGRPASNAGREGVLKLVQKSHTVLLQLPVCSLPADSGKTAPWLQSRTKSMQAPADPE